MDLVGRSVKLRAPGPADVSALVAIFAEPEVVRFLDHWSHVPYAAADAERFLAAPSDGQVRWAIEALEDGVCIGGTDLRSIDHRNRHCWWGIVIGPPSRWGRGLGTEACTLATRFAFRHLGMEKVYLSVYEGNQRGRRAYEKAGYVLEGTHPRDHFLEGELVTRQVMAAYRDHPLYAAES